MLSTISYALHNVAHGHAVISLPSRLTGLHGSRHICRRVKWRLRVNDPGALQRAVIEYQSVVHDRG